MLEKTEFKGKTVVITGAASGMGLFASQTLCEAGANVVMCDLDEARLLQEVERLEVEGLKGGGVEFAQTTRFPPLNSVKSLKKQLKPTAVTGRKMKCHAEQVRRLERFFPNIVSLLPNGGLPPSAQDEVPV